MTIWGIGRILAVSSALYAGACFAATHYFPKLFIISGIPSIAFKIAGAALLAIGIPIWIVSAWTVSKGFKEGQLLTTGVYGWFRHPLYASFILFTVPGIVIFFQSWLLLTVPLFMYVVFKLLIKKEEDYLKKEFGDAYLEYHDKVNAVFPTFSALFRK